jgi:hypothetical protein
LPVVVGLKHTSSIISSVVQHDESALLACTIQ